MYLNIPVTIGVVAVMCILVVSMIWTRAPYTTIKQLWLNFLEDTIHKLK